MKPTFGKASASAIRCSPPPKPTSSMISSDGAEGIEGRRMRCREIAVGAAAGERINQIEADFRGQRFGVFEQRGAGIALLVRRAVQLADDLDADAFGP